MEDDSFTPPTQPFGALVPPTKLPPTALATLPAPVPHRRPNAARTRASKLGAFFSRALDVVDGFADAVAEGLGLRDQ